MTQRTRRQRQGVALLLEVILGLGIFSVALLLSLGVISLSGRASVGAKNHSVGLNLARATLENELSKTFSAVSGNSGAIVIMGERAGIESPVQFTVSVDVTQVEPRLKHVTAKVSWNETGLTRHISLTGFATDV